MGGNDEQKKTVEKREHLARSVADCIKQLTQDGSISEPRYRLAIGMALLLGSAMESVIELYAAITAVRTAFLLERNRLVDRSGSNALLLSTLASACDWIADQFRPWIDQYDGGKFELWPYVAAYAYPNTEILPPIHQRNWGVVTSLPVNLERAYRDLVRQVGLGNVPGFVMKKRNPKGLARFVSAVMKMTGVKTRELHLCCQMVLRFTPRQLAMILASGLPWEQIERALRYIGDEKNWEYRCAEVMEFLPDNEPVAKAEFERWLGGKVA